MKTAAFFHLILDVNRRILQRRVQAFRNQSWLMITVIGLFVISYWVGTYMLFRMGFKFLQNFPVMGGMLLDRMMYLFFAFLFAMLAFSNMIIGYSSLFKSQETHWMLTLPVRHSDVFRWKLLETIFLASWAFLFLSTPLMLGYGAARQVNGWFYLKVFALFLPFAVIPGALGSLVILVMTRYLHRQMFKWLLFGVGTIIIGAAVVFLRPVAASQIEPTQMVAALNQLLHHSQVTLQPLLPSYWVASSMIAWGEGGTWQGTFFFLVLLSNALMATLVCVTVSGRVFYEGFSRNHSQGVLVLGHPILDKEINLPKLGLLERLLQWLPGIHPAARALAIKDLRVFWRDTSQWSQFVIFFGLLGLHILNLRNVAFEGPSPIWMSFVSFLNLGASSLTLATLTTRFVFPQFSLEGKRLWIVGMTPYGLRRVLLEKFWLSSAWSIAITLTLTLLSSYMLHLPSWQTMMFAATVVLMSFALCGTAVGIGALFPNFGTGSTAMRRDDNPAKIVSGFGGTFCFVISIVYLVIVISIEALPMYYQWLIPGWADVDRTWIILAAWLIVSILSAIVTAIPMSLALKKVETMEI